MSFSAVKISLAMYLLFCGLINLVVAENHIANAIKKVNELPSVTTPLGQIRGHYKTSFEGIKYEAFEGIPYAVPPIGKGRFEPPEPVKPWKGVLPAYSIPNQCLQFNVEMHAGPQDNKVLGSEDCLYLNVYRPLQTKNVNKISRVIVSIHGGGFYFASGDVADPSYLISQDIVFVTFNYRLGALGFLSTEDNVVPGNMGLKDQSMALRFVKENIEYFGGDRNSITITGISAGAGSVHYHYLSEMSRGLFHAGISQSGTALNCWATCENSRGKAFALGERLNCPTDNVKELIECLKEVPATEIAKAAKTFMVWKLLPYVPFGPVVEKNSSKPFVDRPPAEIISSGMAADLPWVTSVTSEDGLYPIMEILHDDAARKKLNENWDEFAPILLDYYYTVPVEKHVQVARLVRNYYFGKDPVDRNNLRDLIHLATDRVFAADAQKAAVMQAKSNKSPVWFYNYSYRANFSWSNGFIETGEDYGVCHADDFSLVFQEISEPKDLKMMREMRMLWLSLSNNRTAVIGNFTAWPTVNNNENAFTYLDIHGPNDVKVKVENNFANKFLWDMLPLEENKLIN